MKVAIVCDWLTNVGGAEKVLLAIHNLYPKAPIYTSQYKPKGIDWFKNADVRTGWMQIFPGKLRRFLSPLRQRWFEHLDLSEYDVVISVTGAEAKAVRVREGARHISYCHVPTQYYWQMYDDYMKDPGFGILNPMVRVFFKIFAGHMRKRDFAAAGRVDQFVTISEYAKGLIAKYYKREALVVNPPVEVEDFAVALKNVVKNTTVVGRDDAVVGGGAVEKSVENFCDEGFYVVTARQVTWKRLDLAVLACKNLGRNLLVIGEGPEHKKLVKMADNSPYVKFLPLATKKELVGYLGAARGYLFPSLEPFGIAPVEALAAGCPVVAFAEGGSRDFIVDGKNGVFFDKQTVKSLEKGILEFENVKFDRTGVSKTAEQFSLSRFNDEMLEVVKKVYGGEKETRNEEVRKEVRDEK